MISNSGTSTLGLYDFKRQIDAFGGVDYFRPTLAGGYLPNARVMLNNGDIVQNGTNGNLTNDPNVDMTGWVNTNDATEIIDGKVNQHVKNKRFSDFSDYDTPQDAFADTTVKKLRSTSQVVIDQPVVINRDLSFEFDYDADVVLQGNGSLTFEGSIELIGKPSASINNAGNTLTIEHNNKIKNGDILCIYDPVDFSFDNARNYYRAGEYARVAIVNGNVITLSANTYDDYSTNVDVYKVNLLNVDFNRLSIINNSTNVRPIVFRFASPKIKEFVNSDGIESAVFIDRCYDFDISNTDVNLTATATGTNYGIVVANSQKGRVSNVETNTTRHGISTGGGNEICSVPCRDIIVSESVINSNAGNFGSDFHGNTSDSKYVNCKMSSATLQGKNVSLDGCTIGCTPSGVAITVRETRGGYIDINDCNIVCNNPSVTGQAIVYIILAFDLKEDLFINIRNLKVNGKALQTRPTILVSATVELTHNVYLDVDGYFSGLNQNGDMVTTSGVNTVNGVSNCLPMGYIKINNVSSKIAGFRYLSETNTATVTKLKLPKQAGSMDFTTTSATNGIAISPLKSLSYFYPRIPSVVATISPQGSTANNSSWLADNSNITVMNYQAIKNNVRFALRSKDAIPAMNIRVSYEVFIDEI